MICRASESEAQRLRRLTAGQQRQADCRASESEVQRLERLTAGQQREADRRALESGSAPSTFYCCSAVQS